MYAVTPIAVQSNQPPRKNNRLRDIDNSFQTLNQPSGFSYLCEGLSVLKGV